MDRNSPGICFLLIKVIYISVLLTSFWILFTSNWFFIFFDGGAYIQGYAYYTNLQSKKTNPNVFLIKLQSIYNHAEHILRRKVLKSSGFHTAKHLNLLLKLSTLPNFPNALQTDLKNTEYFQNYKLLHCKTHKAIRESLQTSIVNFSSVWNTLDNSWGTSFEVD